MLHKLRKMLNKERTNDIKTPKPTISFSETLERFNKLQPKKINLEDLQLEVNQIKSEIKQLKTENNNLKSKNANLEDRVSNLIKNLNLLTIKTIPLLKMRNLSLLHIY